MHLRIALSNHACSWRLSRYRPSGSSATRARYHVPPKRSGPCGVLYAAHRQGRASRAMDGHGMRTQKHAHASGLENEPFLRPSSTSLLEPPLSTGRWRQTVNFYASPSYVSLCAICTWRVSASHSDRTVVTSRCVFFGLPPVKLRKFCCVEFYHRQSDFPVYSSFSRATGGGCWCVAVRGFDGLARSFPCCWSPSQCSGFRGSSDVDGS